MADGFTPNVSNREKITDLSLTGQTINSSIVLDLEMYKRVMVNYLTSKQRELYDYNNFPLNYIRSGMSGDRNVYTKMRTHVRTAPDMPWLNIYRNEINKEINLMLDPSSSRLTGYNFIRDTQRVVDIRSTNALADALLFPNKWFGNICYKCSFTHPNYRFEYKKMLEIYPLINRGTYVFIINNCLK